MKFMRILQTWEGLFQLFVWRNHKHMFMGGIVKISSVRIYVRHFPSMGTIIFAGIFLINVCLML